jgi:pyrroline-5-carboxylate reductase
MSFSEIGPVVLAGAGKMGSAMLLGWLERGLKPANVIVQDPQLGSDAAQLMRKHGIRAEASITSLPTPPAVIVAAVKPEVMGDVMPSLAKLAGPGTVLLSIAAGRSIASFEALLPPHTAVVRAMPNTPAAIGRGITGAVGNAAMTEAQKSVCDQLLRAVGEVVWLDDERLIDAVTAVSGSGPAYVFLLTECLAQAGVKVGLASDLALALARATVSGSGELLRQSPLDPTTLRKNVTSPGGTTAAALNVLMRDEGGLQDLMTAAILAARDRGRELGK